jgi:serine/threonine-protein kinase RsbW
MPLEPQAAMTADSHGCAKVLIPGEPVAVRDGLRVICSSELARGLSEDDRGTMEIVLAEVLNNIVEHAYSERPGEIEVALKLTFDSLAVSVVDHGLPMPGGDAPSGNLKPIGDFEDLPEGGFGWHLIRTLSRELVYQRENGQNRLSFRLVREQSQA